MSDEQILVIKPRWFEPHAVPGRLRKLERESPGARITLLAEPGYAYDGALALPALSPKRIREAAQFALRLRRTRYSRVMVLADEMRPDNGYLEAKLWAFVARSRDRRLGGVKRISLRQEIGDKWHEVVVGRLIETFVRGGGEKLVNALVMLKRLPDRLRHASLRHTMYRNATPVTACAVCGGSLTGHAAPDLGRYVRCATCGSIYPDHMPPAMKGRSESQSPPAAAQSAEHTSTLQHPYARRRLEARIYLEQHDRYAGPDRGSFLYAGSATSEYLEAARELGWAATALRSEDGSDANTASRPPEEAIAAIQPDETLRFIALIDIPGHTRDPRTLFAHLTRLLMPEGWCLLRVPDAARLRRNSAALEDPGNLWFPGEAAIRRLAEEHKVAVHAVVESNSEEDALDVWLRAAPGQTP